MNWKQWLYFACFVWKRMQQPFQSALLVVSCCCFVLFCSFFFFFFLSLLKRDWKGSDFRIISFHLLALFASQCFQVCKLFNRFAVSGLASREEMQQQIQPGREYTVTGREAKYKLSTSLRKQSHFGLSISRRSCEGITSSSLLMFIQSAELVRQV